MNASVAYNYNHGFAQPEPSGFSSPTTSYGDAPPSYLEGTGRSRSQATLPQQYDTRSLKTSRSQSTFQYKDAASRSQASLHKMPMQVRPPPQRVATFSPSPDGTPGPELSGDNPKGFMDHVKNFAPGKDPKKLLNPPPASFRRQPLQGLPYDPFPTMVLIGKGNTLDCGFPYISPGCTVVPHPFVTHDVNEQDWRQFLHDVRLAGSLSPMNKVISGLAPLTLGITVVFGFFITKGIDGLFKRGKEGPVSQLIHHWNHYFFHPRCLHVGVIQGPPKDANGKRDRSQGRDSNWRLIISFRPYVPE